MEIGQWSILGDTQLTAFYWLESAEKLAPMWENPQIIEELLDESNEQARRFREQV